MVSITAKSSGNEYNLLRTLEYFELCNLCNEEVDLFIECTSIKQVSNISAILLTLRSLPLKISAKLFLTSQRDKFISMDINIIHSSHKLLSLFKNKLTIVCSLRQFDQLWFRERVKQLKYYNVDAPLIPYGLSLKVVEMYNSNSLHIECSELERFSSINLRSQYIALNNVKESHLISGNIGVLSIAAENRIFITCTAAIVSIDIHAENGLILSTCLKYGDTLTNAIDLIFEHEEFIPFVKSELCECPVDLPSVPNTYYKSGIKKSITSSGQQLAIYLSPAILTRYF
jgi:hypothetical protein